MEQSKLLASSPARHPLEVFSTEVWTMVMEKVEEPKVLWNMVQAHSLFREIWQGKRDAWRALLFCAAIPYLDERLTTKDLLNLRLVSRGTKMAVDDHLESGRSPPGSNGDCYCCRKLMFDLRREIKCKELLNKTRQYPLAKLVGGSVNISITPDFLTGTLCVFLEKHGGRVLDLIVNMEHSAHALTPLQVLDSLYFILEKTPKLKKLTVYFKGIAEEGLLAPAQRWEERVAQRLMEKPFPLLSDLTFLLLQTIATWQIGEASRGILKGVLEAYKNQVHRLVLRNHDVPAPQEMSLVNDLYLYTTYANPRQIGLLQAPVRKLYLDNGRRFKTSEVFKLLEKFGNTLKELLLRNCRDDGFPQEVQLPLLEKLIMVVHRISSWAAFDILLNFPRLRQVDIKFLLEPGLDESMPQVIFVEQYLKENGSLDQIRFKESPVWQRFRYLQSIEVRKVQRDYFYSFVKF